MKFIALTTILIVLVNCEQPQLKRPVLPGYPNNFVPYKSAKQPVRTYMIQIRNGARPQSAPMTKQGVPMQMARLRPVKIMSHAGKHQPMKMQRRPPPQFMTPKPFYNSPHGPNSGEYVYEKPVAQHQTQLVAHQFFQQPQPIENTIKLTTFDATNSGPIHTIPAPNLSNQKIHTYPDLSTQIDNHISLTDAAAYAGFQPSTLRPLQQFQMYQVTEDSTNDHTIYDPFSGQQKLYAPDPDPSLPAQSVRIATDPFSRPSNNRPQPMDIAAAASYQTAANQMYQFVNPIPQQQLSDTYALPLTGQPQLQQHLLQQASLMQGTPLSVYNPTYLVQQSNNLYNQHQQMQQQQLFKPNTNFVSTFGGNNAAPSPQNQFHSQYQSPASQGQLLRSSQYNQNQVNDNYAAAESQFSPTFEQYPSSSITPEYDQLLSASSSSPKPYSQALTAEEFSNLYNLQQINGEQAQPGYDYSARQTQNEKILAQANQELLQNQFQEQNEVSAHEQHHQLLTQQFSGTNPPSKSAMRIFYPDDEVENSNYSPQQRSDDFSYENTSTEEEESDNYPTTAQLHSSTEDAAEAAT